MTSFPNTDQKEPEKEKSKKDGLGMFYSLPQYMKVYEMLRGAYSNYKVSQGRPLCIA